ncbi:probable Transcription elongation factor SPT6 [Ustilago trichophora]|uniref:Transcription elongation factor Spt6 n=1 Tax=Ustilago trichophora TaxID=86804 RepID=A0A5C3DNS4_9BASI|nr:probable Transcription elongation factor SPT6 [Ustilago trichophora]
MADEEKVPAPYFQDDEEGEQSDEGEGVDLMRSDGNLVGSGAEDSSDEDEDDDPEEARRIAEGFIAEDDEEEEEDEEARRERRRRRKKKRKQNEQDFEVDEDDLELLAENTGQSRRKEAGRLKRFRRGSASPPADDEAAARQKTLDQIFEDDDDDDEDDIRTGRRGVNYDDDDEDLPSVGQALRAGVARKQREAVGGYEDDGLDDFIEEDEDDEEMQGLDEEEREARRQERREEKRRARMSGSAADPAKAGIDREAWDEIHEIFGNGEDYFWALEDEDEDAFEEDKKNKMEYKDIFEPAQIAERMLTEEDERIKRVDIPERLQLACPGEEGLKLLERKLSDAELFEAAKWASTRISTRTSAEFLDEAGLFHRYRPEFLNAVQLMLSYMLNDLLEVPFLFQHRFDELELVKFDEVEQGYRNIDLLTRRELYTLSGLGLKFKNLLMRKDQLRATFNKIHVDVKPEPVDDNVAADAQPKDDAHATRVEASRQQRAIFEDMVASAASLEEISDITEYLTLRYGQKMRDAQALTSNGSDEAAEDMEGLTINGEPVVGATPGFKKPSLVGQYERTKNTVLSELAKKFGISSEELAVNVTSSSRQYSPQDPAESPFKFAEQFTGAAWGAHSPEIALAKVKTMLSQEIGKDPILKREMRQLFKDAAEINIEPTERGMTAIDDQHPYANFKFLLNKPARLVPQQPAQYLQMLQAEEELMIKLDINLKDVVLTRFEQRLYSQYASQGVGEVSEAWNAQRREVIKDALKTHLVPNGRIWLKEWLREESREVLLRHVDVLMTKRVQDGPFVSRSMIARNRDPKIEEEDRIPRVLAVSHGGGDPKKDVVQAVYVDERNRFREHATFDDLRPLTARQMQERELEMERSRGKAEFPDYRADFVKLLKQRRPDVVVVSGWSVRTAELKRNVRELVDMAHQEICDEDRLDSDLERDQALIDVVTCHDDVARIYQHSSRAAEEFPELNELGRYCLALARYAQSPVNEFAALGNDLTAVILDPNQRLLPQDRLRLHFERCIGAVVNDIGVEINQAMTSTYLQTMLPFVAGLGPRKAHALVNAISTKLEGTLINRTLLLSRNILTFQVFQNCASFLRIEQDMLLEADEDDVPDVLDSTRIHPEDYDFPRKMAADALNKHEEDLEGEHPSLPCKELMEDADPEDKLNTLDLDNYATMLEERKGERKRATLHSCRTELIKPYDDLREKQREPSPDEILTMFTGETPKTLAKGFVVSVEVMRVQEGNRMQEGHVKCRLDSGIEGTIEAEHTVDNYAPGSVRLRELVRPQQTLDALVTQIDPEMCTVQLSIRPWDLQHRDPHQGKTPRDPKFYDREKAEKWNEQAANKAKARIQARRQNRVIDHPNYHNFNYKQAVLFLRNQPRGSVVVRPSSKGDDHLAVTWKVDDDVYQNIDVTELDKESEYSLGRVLRIEGMGSYSDLDELIVNHVKPMVHMVEMMMNHEKYKGADEEDLHRFLTNWSLANPSRSVYAFGLNKDRPGYFNLSFKANRDAAIQTWPVKVLPNAFKLGPADQLADVAALCNAFKTQYTTQASMARGAKTPYGGGRTPVPGMGGATPMGGRTPYGGMRNGMAGGATPGATMGVAGGYGTPMMNMASATPNPYGGGYGRNGPAAAAGGYGAPPPPGRPPSMPGAPPMMPPGMMGGASAPPPNYPPPYGAAPSGAGEPGPPPPLPQVPHGMHPDRFAQANYGGNSSSQPPYGGGQGGYRGGY